MVELIALQGAKSSLDQGDKIVGKAARGRAKGWRQRRVRERVCRVIVLDTIVE
jgi:hypothetical protein